MIKYVDFDSCDETGLHVIPVSSGRSGLIKTASSGVYSDEINAVLKSMPRDPNLYYVVINAMGTYESWGHNKRGDAFPIAGLTHLSLQSDMGTENDYGYKTFEYYAKLYRHHVNKDPARSFGPVIYSYFNPKIQRVELITGINRITASDLVTKMENGENVAVSMGCKVRYDRCSICGKKAQTREQYCKHLKDYMKVIVDADLAQRWSIELGHTVLPGSSVFAFNDHPRFFDISYVDVGADATAFMLGKAASAKNYYPSSAMVGEVSGVTDDMIEKLAGFGKSAAIKKISEIDKVVGGDPEMEVDGRIIPVERLEAIKKALKAKISEMISHEKSIPTDVLNSMGNRGVDAAGSTLLAAGIMPRPSEIQRITIISYGRPDIADFLDQNNITFDPMQSVSPCMCRSSISDSILRDLASIIPMRSAHPVFLSSRLGHFMKHASAIGPNDYWFERSRYSGSAIRNSFDVDQDEVGRMMGAAAAIYAGLKLQASGLPVGNAIEVFSKRPWMGAVIGGGTYAELLNRIKNSDGIRSILTPTYSDAELDNGALQKVASMPAESRSLMSDYVYNPAMYVNQCFVSHASNNHIVKTASLISNPMRPIEKKWIQDIIKTP